MEGGKHVFLVLEWANKASGKDSSHLNICEISTERSFFKLLPDSHLRRVLKKGRSHVYKEK